jgi:hypothetical protein
MSIIFYPLTLTTNPQVFGLPFRHPFLPHLNAFQLSDDDGRIDMGSRPLVGVTALMPSDNRF